MYYWFDWESTDKDALPSAFQGIEIPFVFGTHDRVQSQLLGDCQPPTALAERVQEAWTAFVRTGRPRGIEPAGLAGL